MRTKNIRSSNLIQILQTNQFKKKYKKLPDNVRSEVNDAIRLVCNDTRIGQEKKGDLAGIRVYKFKIQTLQLLLAYRLIDQNTVLLEMVGSHENFYRDLN